jgi:hypothetical protein
LASSGFSTGFAQAPPNIKTEASCSPVILDSHANSTFNCTGLSKEQAKEIDALLHGIVKTENKNRDLILTRLQEYFEQMMAEMKKDEAHNRPRGVSDEEIEHISHNANLGGGQVLQITAPSGDKEAIALASQLRRLFLASGLKVPKLEYTTSSPHFPGLDAGLDAVLLANQAHQTGAEFVWAAFRSTDLKLKVNPDDTPEHFNRDGNPNQPMQLYVLSK